MKRALITGITGQDGSYLAELLAGDGYEVHGLVRRVAASDQRQRLERIVPLVDAGAVKLHSASVESYGSVCQALEDSEPDEVYHLAAQSFVTNSFEDEHSTMLINVQGTHNVLAALQRIRPKARFYFAGSSEMFGKVAETPQTETTPFRPQSVYAVSKCAGVDLTRYYRARGMHASIGILFNHESPRRGMEFVTRKIAHGVARIATGADTALLLGNLAARRDWGHARDYVEAMRLMLRQDRPGEWVVATGADYSVGNFCQRAFEAAGISDWWRHVKTDYTLFRPCEVDILRGDASKARNELGWEPRTDFAGLVREMVESELRKVRTA